MNLSQNKIAIIGLGYVGLPLAVEFGKKYSTTGFDINKKRIGELKLGIDLTKETTKDEIENSSRLNFTNDSKDISECNFFIITVPTPIDNAKRPDLQPLKEATKLVSKLLKPGDHVIYESTVFPGCTEEICVPILEKTSSLTFNKDFFCGYSPERVNPGDKINTLTKIKKITSGSTPESGSLINDLYN